MTLTERPPQPSRAVQHPQSGKQLLLSVYSRVYGEDWCCSRWPVPTLPLPYYTATTTASWGEEEKMTSPRGRHIHSFLAPLIIYDGSTRHLSDQLIVVIVVVEVGGVVVLSVSTIASILLLCILLLLYYYFTVCYHYYCNYNVLNF